MTRSDNRREAALIIFAKAPIPGQVKTRLCPPLTPDEAATLQGSLVLDVVERSRGVAKQAHFDRVLACAPSREHVFFKILGERHGIRLIDQAGNDVGARMDQAFKAVFALGYRRIVMVGTDIPTLLPSSLTQAFSLLATHDLILGPALDGGYYLLGLTRPVPELFEGIPWSTEQVCTLTRKKAEALGLKTALLPACRDLDRIEDLRAFIQETGREARGTRREATRTADRHAPLAPGLSMRTAEVLRMLAERLRSRLGVKREA
jgi:rSAM/selenodomain-associated transferase 1